MKHRITLIALALGCGMSAAHADDSTFDPRALAMGGTGVATANTRNAAFQDPAMLAAKQSDSFAWEIPIVSVRLQDQNKLQSDISSLKTNANNLTTSIQAFQANPSQANAGTAASALSAFNSSLMTANDKTLMADLFAGTMLGIPSKKYGFALYVDGRAEVGARFNYATADQTTMGTLGNAFSSCAANAANCTASATTVNNMTTNGKINNLQSQLQVRGVTIKELGISAAHHFEDWDNFDVGITPKMQQLNTYDYGVNPQAGQGISLSQGKVGYSAFNMDLGAVKNYQTEEGNSIKGGVVVKNMLPKSFGTVLGDHIDIKPQATVGMAYLTKLTTTGIDVDVIPNKPVINGFSKESQYVRLGAEFDAWRWAQIRVGYRHDLRHNYPGLPSFGLGLSPLGIHIDISAAYASKEEAALSLQTGFNF